jgi:hypothetical protein
MAAFTPTTSALPLKHFFQLPGPASGWRAGLEIKNPDASSTVSGGDVAAFIVAAVYDRRGKRRRVAPASAVIDRRYRLHPTSGREWTRRRINPALRAGTSGALLSNAIPEAS